MISVCTALGVLASLVCSYVDLSAMETGASTTSSAISPVSVVKALYLWHKSIPNLRKGLGIVYRIEELGVEPEKTITLMKELYSEPTFIVLRTKNRKLFTGFLQNFGKNDKNTKQVVSLLEKTDHPDVDQFIRALKTSKEITELSRQIKVVTDYINEIDIEALSCDDTFAPLKSFSTDIIASSQHIQKETVRLLEQSMSVLVRGLENSATISELEDLSSESFASVQLLYKYSIKNFEKNRLEEILKLLTSETYESAYAKWYQKVLSAFTKPRDLKNALSITIYTEREIPLSRLDEYGMSWKRALLENNRATQQAQKKIEALSTIKKASDGSYVVEETEHYVIIADPRNAITLTLYKTGEPQEVGSIGYDSRVTDLFGMTREALVKWIAETKNISLLVAHVAAWQKTPALATDWYIQYAHDGLFKDASGRNIKNKTILCRVKNETGVCKEYFMTWGFDDKGTCYHRGLSFNSSIEEAIRAIANSICYPFDFPPLK